MFVPWRSHNPVRTTKSPITGKSFIDESSFGYSLLAPYKNSDHFDKRTTKPVMRKNVTTWVHLFGLTNKATWLKSLTSGAKINRPACLRIRSLPVSVVKGTRKYERVNMEKVAVFLSQFPAVLFSGSRFLNFADLTVLEPGTNLRSGFYFRFLFVKITPAG